MGLGAQVSDERLSGAGFRVDTRPPIPKGVVLADWSRAERCTRCGRSWEGTVVHSGGAVLARWRSFCSTYPHSDETGRAM